MVDVLTHGAADAASDYKDGKDRNAGLSASQHGFQARKKRTAEDMRLQYAASYNQMWYALIAMDGACEEVNRRIGHEYATVHRRDLMTTTPKAQHTN